MHRPVPRSTRLAAPLAAALALTACTGGDDTTPAVAPPAGPAVTVPAVRDTPFCQSMIETSQRLTSDPPADVTAYVIERYEAIVDDVPTEIRADFEYVLADLRGDPLPDLPELASSLPTLPPPTSPSISAPTTTVAPTTTATPVSTAPADATQPDATTADDGSVPASTRPEVDEFFPESVTPAERLSDYVDFTCRGSLNNPGPPATSPDVEPPDPGDP